LILNASGGDVFCQNEIICALPRQRRFRAAIWMVNRMGRVPVAGAAEERLLADEARALMAAGAAVL